MLQAYSALPFNITSGVTTIQGTAGRPIVDGGFIPRNAGIGRDFFSMSLRLSRGFRIAGADEPLPSFNQITAVGGPADVAVRGAGALLG